ncbi:hypothetical protein V9T40_007645 [Parthenolecanium corni]|uniref:Uncharacterized protein n=1 Tax=Parthenolecanium corni TaxID=536013 RepID=A0AAN9TK92_9HEMI
MEFRYTNCLVAKTENHFSILPSAVCLAGGLSKDDNGVCILQNAVQKEARLPFSMAESTPPPHHREKQPAIIEPLTNGGPS